MSGIKPFIDPKANAGTLKRLRFGADGVEIECFPALPLPDLSATLTIVSGEGRRPSPSTDRWWQVCEWVDAGGSLAVVDVLAEGDLTLADLQWNLERGTLAYLGAAQ